MKLSFCFAVFAIAFGEPLEFEILNELQISVNENSEEISIDCEFEMNLNGIEQMMKFPRNLEKMQEIRFTNYLDIIHLTTKIENAKV